MEKKHHFLKILPGYYEAIDCGTKTFEVRYDDRNYKQGDILHLREWDGSYTGREVTVEVTYLISDNRFCKDGYVIMSFKVVNQS